MISNEERREIAEQLRINSERRLVVDRDTLRHTTGLEPFTVDDDTTLSEIDESDSETWSRLADLIDPTCRNKQIAYNRTAPREFRTDNFICSACGETFCADGDGVNHPIDWAYCPNCGARVTGVDA